MTKHIFSTSFTLLTAVAYPASAALAADHGTPGTEASLAAVSAPNAKASAGGGSLDGEAFGYIEGSFSFPITSSFGMQLDGLGGIVDDGSFFGVGAHVFWRNPNSGLLGLYAGVTSVDYGFSDYVHHAIGVEGHAYLGNISLEGLVGHEGGDNVDDGLFGILTIALYPTDDLRLYGGVRHIQDTTFGAAGLEYQFTLGTGDTNFSIYAEGRAGEGNHQIWAGLRIHTGDPKTLIRRHREDDPTNPSLDFLFQAAIDNASTTEPTPSEEPTPPPP